MNHYRLRYLDHTRKFIRADLLSAATDREAIRLARQRKLGVRSEVWRGTEVIAKLRPLLRTSL